MCLLIFCMKCCKAWTRSIHSWAYAHKHVLCSSVTKSLRDAASVCIASDARSWPSIIAQSQTHVST